jgi:hypothetical protein
MNEWLDGVFGSVRCANCGATYGRDSIAVIGNRGEYWFVRCACVSCGTQWLGVVIVRRVAEGPPVEVMNADSPAAEAGWRMDDVLEAHELLRDYRGDAHGLFEKVPRR